MKVLKNSNIDVTCEKAAFLRSLKNQGLSLIEKCHAYNKQFGEGRQYKIIVEAFGLDILEG